MRPQIFKKVAYYFIVLQFILFYNPLFAQWTILNNTGASTSVWFKDIFCTDNNICYIVGWGGTVYKTIDGGNSWQLINNGIDVSGTYKNIYCLDSLKCWITGGSAKIYKTQDGGNLWQPTNVPFLFSLGDGAVFMVNDTIGYTGSNGGGYYLKTTDGFNWSWEDVLISGIGFSSAYFFNENIGLGVGYGPTIYKTINGGNNWSYVYTNSNTSGSINDIICVNDSICFACGDNGLIVRTFDQGANWDSLYSGLTGTLHSISCINQDTCYISAVAGWIIKTIDGGNTWNNDSSNVSKNLFSIFSTSPTVAYAVGASATVIKKGETTGVKSINILHPFIGIYPNPFSDKTVIYYVPSKKIFNPVFELYDIAGRKLLKLNLLPGKNILTRNNLSSGFYLYQLKDKELNILTTGKIIIN